MLIRQYRPADLAALRRMHSAQGLDYELPEPLEHPLLLSKLVVEGEDGKVMMASLLRLTAEAYLLADPQADDPRGRWCALQSLHEAVRQDAFRQGLDDVQAFVPPDIARRFRKRLVKLGWLRSAWEPWTRSTLGATWPET